MILSYLFKYFEKIFSLCIYDFRKVAVFPRLIEIN
jgi:hypothetical protein